MNCTHCHTALPDNATFCSQCGSPTTTRRIFAPDPPVQQVSQKNHFLLGCTCITGAFVLVVALMAGTIGVFWLDDSTFVSSSDFEVGSDFALYGRTLDDEEFDWESYRGQYVLVKFTATWCGPCKMQIPVMREVYEKYHDKGFEIVSVYIWDKDAETIEQSVQREKLPWTIISEPLTEKAGQPPQGKTFGIQGVPTMLLVDKEGKVLATDTRDARLKQELKKLFGE